jgi:hypothetical protein
MDKFKITQIMPAVGWRVIYVYDEGEEVEIFYNTLVGFGLTVGGSVIPLVWEDTDIDDPTTVSNYAGLCPPGFDLPEDHTGTYDEFVTEKRFAMRERARLMAERRQQNN